LVNQLVDEKAQTRRWDWLPQTCPPSPHWAPKSMAIDW